jgi:hypothetical protein
MTLNDLKQLNFLYKEVDRLKYKIEHYRPAEIVADSVKGSSAMFPYVEHSFVIEGYEQKKDSLSAMNNKLEDFKRRLNNQILYIEDEIEKIDNSEIRLIISYRFLDRMSWLQIMTEMDYNNQDTPRMKLNNYFKKRGKDK